MPRRPARIRSIDAVAVAVSILDADDERLHYIDGSHRWIPPDPDYSQEEWDEIVRQHMLEHLRGEQPRVKLRRLS